ncbi:SmpA / OmlA family protein [Azotobacter beijerinckii]|uniref:SmpA / OmlA family protein n=1 Tax=Azotobacter beijerinckii TaxID=170623 RepID=A0A1H6VS35_9GAMM|nr:outer membrane protein assembly factor BamE [Azotobacter beijerinckii]MDV7212346.1 outer membrane protein assembly factor BamE [Azotobacter beijerinckii]SEI78969.1 SmpA / OmlA family protein [Azotobacter beijerinckii]SEJ04617.1 SmpA / OmlA family protein [Azotobacter beijerinckii]SER60342.1 SmpA / OmlA family protein [Azotobacter beijerinckii]SFA79607.1 SmpA / OmlA family protein [Azotobacter beijerinckii]
MSRRFALLSLCLLLAACSDPLNQENYSKLKPGMTRPEVEQLLGKPTECSGAFGFSSCTWGDQRTFISVQYGGDKVLLFSGQGLR